MDGRGRGRWRRAAGARVRPRPRPFQRQSRFVTSVGGVVVVIGISHHLPLSTVLLSSRYVRERLCLKKITKWDELSTFQIIKISFIQLSHPIGNSTSIFWIIGRPHSLRDFSFPTENELRPSASPPSVAPRALYDKSQPRDTRSRVGPARRGGRERAVTNSSSLPFHAPPHMFTSSSRFVDHSFSSSSSLSSTNLCFSL